MKLIGYALAVVLGVYLMARAVAEFFLLDLSDPAAYRDDWGGPGLAGVLAVHCGPGLLALVLFGYVVSTVPAAAGPRWWRSPR